MLRLILAPFRLIRWCLFTVSRIVGSHAFMFCAFLFAIVMMVQERRSWPEVGWYFLILWFSLILAQLGMVLFRPGGLDRRARIPVAAVLVKGRGKAPTMRVVLGRLDPALRRVMETPPPAVPASRP